MLFVHKIMNKLETTAAVYTFAQLILANYVQASNSIGQSTIIGFCIVSALHMKTKVSIYGNQQEPNANKIPMEFVLAGFFIFIGISKHTFEYRVQWIFQSFKQFNMFTSLCTSIAKAFHRALECDSFVSNICRMSNQTYI